LGIVFVNNVFILHCWDIAFINDASLLQ
jgi:hypothetical protein